MHMRLLLVVPRYYPDWESNKTFYLLPWGLMYISSYLKQQGFEVHVLNQNHYGPDKLAEILSQNSFDAVLTGGLQVHLQPVKRVVDIVKDHDPRILTIVGGPMATSHAELVIESLEIDYAVLGEGEEVAFNLLTALQGGQDVQEILGIAYRKNGEFVKTPEAPRIADLDALPFPDYESFEFDHYLDNYEFENQMEVVNPGVRMAYIAGSRDCPAKCTFCFRTMGGEYVVRSVDNVMKEIKFLIERYRVNQIELSDEIFSVNKKRVYEFCDQIEKLNIPWTCQIRVNMINEALILRMKEAGCILISYGLESASPAILKSMQKGVRVDQIETALQATRKAKVTIQGNWIFGDPAESPQTVRETLDFNRKYRDYCIHLDVLLAYPGTPMYFDALERGLVADRIEFFETGHNEHGEPLNVTSMSEDDYYALRKKLLLEARATSIFGKILKIKGIKGGKFLASVICPYCEFCNEDMIVVKRAYGMIPFACRSCFQRFKIDEMGLPKYQNLFKRNFKLLKRKIGNTTLFLLSLKFEPDLFKNKPLWFLLMPVYYTVSVLRINTIIGKCRRIRRKIKSTVRQQPGKVNDELLKTDTKTWMVGEEHKALLKRA